MEIGRKYTYFDYAEQDYLFLIDDYERGKVGNLMATSAQNTCERYFKHIIEIAVEPQNKEESVYKAEILRTHSLTKLMAFIEAQNIYTFTTADRRLIKSTDGYCFSTRYPGDDSIMVTKEDVDDCMDALERCRSITIEMN